MEISTIDQEYANSTIPRESNQSILKRADTNLDLIVVLIVAGRIDLPVALSKETPFGGNSVPYSTCFSKIMDDIVQGGFTGPWTFIINEFIVYFDTHHVSGKIGDRAFVVVE